MTSPMEMHSKFVLAIYFCSAESCNWSENGQWLTAISGSAMLYCGNAVHIHKWPLQNRCCVALMAPQQVKYACCFELSVRQNMCDCSLIT